MRRGRARRAGGQSPEPSEGVAVYRRRAYSRFAASGSGAMTAVALTGLIAPSTGIRVLFGALGLCSAWVTYRAARMATIIVGPRGIVVRQYLKDRHIAWQDVRRFVTQQRLSGLGQPGRTLAAQLEAGETVRFGEFFSLKRRGDEKTVLVERIADDLNARLAAARGNRASG
jgi:hypothetical protein